MAFASTGACLSVPSYLRERIKSGSMLGVVLGVVLDVVLGVAYCL